MTHGTVVVTVNGEATDVPEPATVSTLVSRHTGREITAEGLALDGSRLGLAVAVGEEVVPRSAWATTRLAAGDAVEIVTAVQGG
ncbi:sulfur carrier protein ThiS [Falsarthrobacter nasiphocae]|uniref:Sulfur carrier protein n=1 Tax=Falsarthrobacter nasiphocae TaxID=189863 RepID=A0AAE3YGD7_9MICC|nr:sulfur carrier protein ThiS [Falsarthrobacter nasiphocae]MDR6892949.1 sulfur carrier protein [Falsarthrobacter nasiphocae]